MGGQTATLAAPLSQVVMFGGDITATVSAEGYEYVVKGQTLGVGRPAVTVDGTRVSLLAGPMTTATGKASAVLDVGGAKTTLEPPTPIVDLDFDDGVRVTVMDGETRLVVGEKTVVPGEGEGVGLEVDVGAGGTVVVLGGRTSTVGDFGASRTARPVEGGREEGNAVRVMDGWGLVAWVVGMVCLGVVA